MLDANGMLVEGTETIFPKASTVVEGTALPAKRISPVGAVALLLDSSSSVIVGI